MLPQILRRSFDARRKLASTAAANPLFEIEKVFLNDLSKFEKKVFKWFGAPEQIDSANQIPIKLLEKAKSKFWISVNVGSIILSSIVIGGSVYQLRSTDQVKE